MQILLFFAIYFSFLTYHNSNLVTRSRRDVKDSDIIYFILSCLLWSLFYGFYK